MSIVKREVFMRLLEIKNRIIQEADLPDRNDSTVIKWSVENKPNDILQDYISAIREDDLQNEPILDRERREIAQVKILANSPFFIDLANFYASAGLYDNAIQLFKEIHGRESNEPRVLNDYGATLLNKMLKEGPIERDRLDLARQLIFQVLGPRKRRLGKNSHNQHRK